MEKQYCNYCRKVTSTKDSDCVQCGLSKPNQLTMEAIITKLASHMRLFEDDALVAHQLSVLVMEGATMMIKKDTSIVHATALALEGYISSGEKLEFKPLIPMTLSK